MIPNWVAGRAASDMMDRARRQSYGSPSPSNGSRSFVGAVSFIGISLVVLGTFLEVSRHYEGSGFLACVLAILTGIATYWAAYRTRGGIGVTAGIGFAWLSAYARHVIPRESGDASLFWDIVVFLAVGIDQLVLKLSARKQSGN